MRDREAEALELLRRQSGLRLDRDAVWWLRDQRVPNERVCELFHRGLRVDAVGEVRLTVGEQWAYVDAEETVWFVRRVREETDGQMTLVLSDGAEEALDPAGLSLFGDQDLYVRVKDGRSSARLLRTAYHHLVHHLDVNPSGEITFRYRGRRYPVLLRDAPPGVVESPSSAPAAGGRP